MDFEPSSVPWIENVELNFSLDEESDMLIMEYPQYVENPPRFDPNNHSINTNELRQIRLSFKNSLKE
ncbi:MAG: hypothetical protein OIN90_16400 [Candidatus Methanoperedens sp.]|nr:hypothetical protein [Candidatus Methanoperedens sp.]